MLQRQRGSRMRALVLPALATMWLSGCAILSGDCDLLSLKDYDAETNGRLADEIEAAPEAATWPRIVTDYILLRDEVRSCQGAL
jgi:hypothetical protein